MTDHNGLSSDPPEVPNATAASMLGLLTWKPMTGWEMVATFERTIGNFWSVTRSQVYRELQSLEKSGLVELAPSGSREKRQATITPAGLRAFRAWIARRPGDESIRFPLLLTTFFADAVPAESLRATFVEHRAIHAARLVDYEAQCEAAREHPAAALTLSFGINYERAVLAWIDALPWMA
jgi:DNA-binding PadR family transcriptional regulator